MRKIIYGFTIGVLLACMTGETFIIHHLQNSKSKANTITVRSSSKKQIAGSKPSNLHSFTIRGVIEGFYGAPWTQKQRMDMLKFLGQNHFTTYVYAPKDDPYQRAKWGKLYPPYELQSMKQVVECATENGIDFVYSLSPGIPEPLPNQSQTRDMEDQSITFTSKTDQNQLVAKIDQLRSLGIHTFLLSFDDVEKYVKPQDRVVYGENYAQAHIDLANLVYRTEKKQDSKFQLWFVPTVYYGLQDNQYWESIRLKLDPAIQVMWTGNWILNQQITSSEANQVGKFLGRKPLIWDNYPVNDYTYVVKNKPALFMGPLENRSFDLYLDVSGYVANPMIQPEASKVSLSTVGQYLYDPYSYHPQAAWEQSVQSMQGVDDTEAFTLFCSFASESILRNIGNEDFYNLWQSYLKQYKQAPDKESINELTLQKELSKLAHLPTTLHATIHNPSLLAEIDPWLLKLGQEGEVAIEALDYLKMNRTGANRSMLRTKINQQMQQLQDNPLNIGNEIILMIQKIMKDT